MSESAKTRAATKTKQLMKFGLSSALQRLLTLPVQAHRVAPEQLISIGSTDTLLSLSLTLSYARVIGLKDIW